MNIFKIISNTFNKKDKAEIKNEKTYNDYGTGLIVGNIYLLAKNPKLPNWDQNIERIKLTNVSKTENDIIIISYRRSSYYTYDLYFEIPEQHRIYSKDEIINYG